MKNLLACAFALLTLHSSADAATRVKARAQQKKSAPGMMDEQPSLEIPKPSDKANVDRSDLKGAGNASAAARAETSKDRNKITPAKMGVYSAGDDQERDAAADKRREEAIAELQQILPNFDEGEQKADLLYRLAELYWEKAKYTYSQEFRAYDEKVEQWSSSGAGTEPKLDGKKSEELKKQAIAVYDQVLKKYPNYKRNDEVLFNKANSLYEGGDKKQATELYAQLIRHYPQSTFLPDTYLALGEHYFNANELGKAMIAYQKAVQTNKTKIYGFALYKLAWCDYNAQDFAAALQKFKEVVEYSDTDKKKKKDRVQLRQEALKDMLLAFSQMDAIDEAKDYYTGKVEREEMALLLESLGSLYEDQGKYELAVKTYKMVTTEWPLSVRAPQNLAAIISAYAAMQAREKVREEVKRLVALYKPSGQWAQSNAQNKQALAEAYALTERSLRELTLEFHAEAQKVNRDGDKLTADKSYALARDLYREYLDAFAENENAYKMRFNYAETLFREKAYAQAAEQFDKVAAQYPKGKYLKDAAFSSVQSWEMLTEGGTADSRARLRGLGKMQRLQKGKDYPELPISEPYQKLAAACERFVRALPNDPDVVKVKFKEARIFFIHNHFEEAGTRFAEIIERWPNDKLGRLAATLVLEGYNIREKWTELNRYARSAQQSQELMRDEQFAKETQEFVEGSAFKLVQELEEQGQLAGAGQKYRDFAEEFPRSRYADVALYNAVVISDKANQLDVALSSAEKLLRDYPDTKTRESVSFMIAAFYERTGELEKALRHYERFAAAFPSSAKAQDAEYNVALFQDALGQSKAAVSSYEKYLQAYPNADDAIAIYLKLGAVYERSGDGKKAVEHYGDLEKHYRDVPLATQFETREKIVKVLREKKGGAEHALAEEKAIWDRFSRLRGEAKRDPRVVKVAAQARFDLFENKYQDYVALKLKLPQKVLTDNLVKKAKLLSEIERQYTEILALGNGDVGIACLARIGMAYHDFSEELFEAPVPPGLSEDQREIYLGELQNKAFPIEEKAIEAYETTLKKAQELHIYSEWTTKTQDRLAQFKPAAFPEVRKFKAQPADRFSIATVVQGASR